MTSRLIIHSTLILSFVFLFISNVGSTTPWKSGYFINNSGDTTHCLIKDEDWKNNPDQFKWRTSLNGDTRIASIEFVSRFLIDSTALYIRDTIQFETSTSKVDQLSTSREPEFETRVTYLKVLVYGQASLYYYEKGDAQRFFFSGPGHSSPEALIFKMYKTDEGEVRQNIKFREQIWKSFDCEKLVLTDINELPYERKDLVNHFIKINQCLNSDHINYNKFRTKGDLRVNAFLAVYSAPTRLVSMANDVSAGYKSSFPWQAGVEFEYLFPFWNNNWSFILAPSVIRYKSQAVYTLGVFSYPSTLEYSTLDLQFAVRRYFNIFVDETFFVNAGLVISYPIRSKFTRGSSEIEVSPSRNFLIGFGYNIVERVSAEFRVGIDRDLSWGAGFPWRVESNYYGLVMHVNLF